MSDTKRRVEVGWGPGNPKFDQWNAGRPATKHTQSVKHQTSDRRNSPSKAHLNRSHRFTKGVKNTLHNLEKKADDLRTKEALGLANPGVTCKLCHNLCNPDTAHLHQGGWIGDECCWDERLRASE